MSINRACPAQFNLADYVLSAGRSTPDKAALELVGVDRAEIWSYARLEAAVLGTATAFLEYGLKPGDRVILRLGNGVSFPIAYLAAISVDIIPVPTSIQLTEFEINKIAQHLEPKLVLASPGVAVPNGIPIVEEVELYSFHERPPAKFIFGSPDRLAYIVMTSGTSGKPRAVAHAHRAVWARRSMWDGWYGLGPSDRLLHAGALNWTYTLGTGLMDPWACGATALVAEDGTKINALPRLLGQYEATMFAAAPGVFRRILRDAGDDFDLPKLRHGLSAGEKLPEETRQAWETATGTCLHEAYGQSECSTFISGSPRRPAPPETLGYPQDGRKVATLGGDGAPARTGETGSIAIHKSDPGLMLGYVDGRGRIDLPLTGDWILTGDTAAADADGAIHYMGRDDDMMTAGGYRVSPIEVEAALATHPGIEEAAVAEVEVKSGTNVIAAWICAEKPIDEGQIKAHVQTLLAAYKIPRLFIEIDELPRGANGKLLRRHLRQTYRGLNDKT